jgi:hypothetical protein
VTRALARRVETLEALVAARPEPPADLGHLSRDELLDLAAECLIARGVDPVIAREIYEHAWMLHGRHPKGGVDGGWAELAVRADDVMRVYVDDLKWRAELGGASPEAAARLEEHDFRRPVQETACRAFGWKDGLESYVQAWGWAVAQAAAGVPAETLTRAADAAWHAAYERYETERVRRAGIAARPS